MKENNRHHILDLDNFPKEEIEEIFQTTDDMMEILQRNIKKVPILVGKVIVNLFYEASTRTRVSFERAGKILSADVINITNTGSSIEKGESLYNTALTLQALKADVIVIRHPHEGAAYFIAQHLDTAIINAGDGTHAHPTQALADLYTIQKQFKRIKELKVVIIGDVLHSRVARSSMLGLATMGADITLCGPPTLIPMSKYLSNSVKVEYDIEQALQGADVIMTLRLQLERQQTELMPNLQKYSKHYGLTSQRVALANTDVLVMHPGPINEGVEISSDVAHGIRSVIEKQVTNGLATRMALLSNILL